jgi:protein SCO1/2
MSNLSTAVRRALLLLLVASTASLSFYLSGAPDERAQRGPIRKQSDKLPNILLYTQHGAPVRFYDDLVKDKTVVINLMFTGCGEICPANTAALARVHESLGRRVGRDIVLLSISIDPLGDPPERLKGYWEAFGSKPGWLFLTGKPGDIERLRRGLGLYDLEPLIDADRAQHSGILTVGNDRTDRWIAMPALSHAGQLAGAILRISPEL